MQSAESILQEISDAKEKLKTLSPIMKWIKGVEKDPKKSAELYFDIFSRLVEHCGSDEETLKKLSLLVHFKANPLSVKNKGGLNPFEYFYQKNREFRLKLHDPKFKHQHLIDQIDHRLIVLANRISQLFEAQGFTEEQLKHLKKSKQLWENYGRLIHKEENTTRVAFARLLKTVSAHPEDVLPLSEFVSKTAEAFNEEQQAEKKALADWEAWYKKDYRAQFHHPSLGRARPCSPWYKGLYGFRDTWKQYLLYQPLPETSQQAVQDFLVSLKDLDLSFQRDAVLTPKMIKAYKRVLNPPKKFERTR